MYYRWATNCLITVPIHQSRSEDIGYALIENVISKCFMHNYIIMDQDSAFMSSLIKYLLKKLGIKIKTVEPYNQQLLQAEHGIKSLYTILTKHLPKYLPLATFAYNTFNTPNLAYYSPYKLVFGRKPKSTLTLRY